MTILTLGKFVPVQAQYPGKNEAAAHKGWVVGRECELVEEPHGVPFMVIFTAPDRYLSTDDQRWSAEHAPRLNMPIRFADPVACYEACRQRNSLPIQQWTIGL